MTYFQVFLVGLLWCKVSLAINCHPCLYQNMTSLIICIILLFKVLFHWIVLTLVLRNVPLFEDGPSCVSNFIECFLAKYFILYKYLSLFMQKMCQNKIVIVFEVFVIWIFLKYVVPKFQSQAYSFKRKNLFKVLAETPFMISKERWLSAQFQSTKYFTTFFA